MSDVSYIHRKVIFEWDNQKAIANQHKHDLSFESACEAFFAPFLGVLDDMEAVGDELREKLVGMTRDWRIVLVVYVMRADRCVSFRPGMLRQRKGSSMKINELRQRLKTDRPMVTISLRMPEDVLHDLKRVAPLLGFSGYQPLMRAYIGQGLRADLERLDSLLDVPELLDSLRRQGVGEEVLESALAEARAVYSVADESFEASGNEVHSRSRE